MSKNKTNKKPWYKSKTVLTSIAAGAIGVLQSAGVHIPEGYLTILAALGLYGLRVGQGVNIDNGENNGESRTVVAGVRG